MTFAGFTLAQFEEESEKPLDIRTEMADLKTKLKGLNPFAFPGHLASRAD